MHNPSNPASVATAHSKTSSQWRPWMRRRPPPRTSTLIINELGKGNTAVIGAELYQSLFGDDEDGDEEKEAAEAHHEALAIAQESIEGNLGADGLDTSHSQKRETQVLRTGGNEPTQASPYVRHVAIAPWFPPSTKTVETSSWTILPVRLNAASHDGGISVPATALGLQSFGAALRASRGDVRTKSGFDVLVVPVKPLELSEVFVKIDAEALRKHEEVQRKFGGGFLSNSRPNSSGKGKSKSQDGSIDSASKEDTHDRLKLAVRTALSETDVVHVNDQLQIPLPAHPITHVVFPPVEVIICLPVDQGCIGSTTKVVLDLETPRGPHRPHASPPPSRTELLGRYITEEDEDTANDSFYSAAESGRADDFGEADANSVESSDDPSSSAPEDLDSSDDGGISDDSGDELISLNSSMLQATSGIMSSRTAATPRPFGFRQPSGVQSPKSVYSSYTVTTARPGGLGGRTFQLRPLYNKVADILLHPRPKASEDDESRIFVDVKMLTRLGCFSGDWVKLVINNASAPYRSWSMNELDVEDTPEDFRVVKVYGLPDIPGHDALQYAKSGHGRRLSQSSIIPMGRPVPNAYVSPILFANLGHPATCNLAALSLTSHDGKRFFRSKLINSASPPVAKEVTLLRLPTPLSTERAVQSSLVASLRQYFETRQRLIRVGDLVAIRFQPQVSRVLQESSDPNGESGDNPLEEFLAATSSSIMPAVVSDDVSVAWFKIGQLTGGAVESDDPLMDRELWGGMMSIEPLVTKMVQSGRAPGRTPPLLQNPWPYYFSMKPFPRNVLAAPTAVPNAEASISVTVRPLQFKLREILAAATSPQAKRFKLAPSVILLHSTQRRIGKAFLAAAACADLGLHAFPIDAYDILSEGANGGDVKTEATLRARIERGLDCGQDVVVPIVLHTEALTADRIATTIQELLEELRALVLTTTEIEKVPDNVRSLVTHEIEVSAPDEGEREVILRDIIQDRDLALALDIELGSIALKTAALVAGDLVDVVERASISHKTRLENLSFQHDGLPLSDILVAGGQNVRCLTKPDFESAVDATRKNFADSIGAPKIPNVRWADVGGLAHAQAALRETIQLPLERPELFARGARKRSGVLLYGPPGTGKTLLAKAVATEFSLNFFSVKGPELLNMYIGESEANVRRVFARARDARPCVVFFDELDAVAPRRGNQGDSGGVMDRIVSQLLAELDGMSGGGSNSAESDGSGAGSGGGGVFVIGATNRPDLLDPALLRPGRFDKMLYLGVPDTHDAQRTVLEALTRKFSLDPELSLARIANGLPFTYTGADMYALCADAMLKAIMRRAASVESKIRKLEQDGGRGAGEISTAWFFDHLATEEDTDVSVTEPDFEDAKDELVASVSAAELAHYQRVRATFEDQSIVPSDASTGAKTNADPSMSLQPLVTSQSSAPHAAEPSTPPTATGRSFPLGPPTSAKGKHARLVRGRDGAVPNGTSVIGGDAHQPPANERSLSNEDDEDDEAYVTSNDFASPERRANGQASTGWKGKGKAVMREGSNGFADPAADDESELYG